MKNIKLITVSSAPDGDYPDVLFAVTEDNKIYKMSVGTTEVWKELPPVPDDQELSNNKGD
jgi:hypothetical protein